MRLALSLLFTLLLPLLESFWGLATVYFAWLAISLLSYYLWPKGLVIYYHLRCLSTAFWL